MESFYYNDIEQQVLGQINSRKHIPDQGEIRKRKLVKCAHTKYRFYWLKNRGVTRSRDRFQKKRVEWILLKVLIIRDK